MAVALLGIGKGVVHISVLVLFHHRQRAERFGQHGELVHVNRFFSRSGAEYGAFYPDEVADVEQLLEYGVVYQFSFGQVVPRDVQLDAAFGVEQFGKRSLAHYAAAHHTSGQHHFGAFELVEIFADVAGMVGHGKFGGRIRVDAGLTQFLQRLSAYDLLF